ncbi:MAG: response regulator transcription factor [Actinobacteria bacterium]|nr:response regulator transcription factor [Actinomycetota bacterium]
MTVRVLIVDDQAPFRSAARMVVEMTDDFEVLDEAETGEEAVAKALDLRPDLVLMDVNLPGIDGLEATRQILAGESSIRVVVLSTYEASEYGPRASEAGAIAFVSKSAFTPDALEEAWNGAAVA